MVESMLRYDDARQMRDELASEATSKLNLSSNAKFVFGEVYVFSNV